MQLRTLGTTGIKVSPLALGAMNFGAWGNPDHEDSTRIIHRALEAGINLIDTADIYSFGESEEIIGKAIAGRRDDVVLATKFANPLRQAPNQGGTSRRYIKQAVEDSLRRLGTDRIDLYQVHRPDYSTGLDDTLSALSDLVRDGKVLAVGSSTFPASLVVEAQWVAEKRGHHRFTTEQSPYSLLSRGIETELLPATQQYGMGVLVWSPLANGWLSGKYRKGVAKPEQNRALDPSLYDLSTPINQRKLEAADALGALADEVGVSLVHLALAFVIRHPGVTSALVGPRTMQHLETQLGAADYVIPDDVLDRIDEIVAPGTTINTAEDYAAPHPRFADKAQRRR
ncbi:aldo/keto reductase [Actinoplanes couchii]|uniref:Aldo/keto reductase n=1 Tax=Actinoplanes couchii TaxID=403638 RepID=A0ABQ3XJF3_9ACTN|nr:aldo/keto reductase [Actinoplanes couchii]MDR6324378.1 aryl-alcohol dehydrogenase-like predicted oxidoreductase [Actinoplanes couchii]GID58623.1 aldo/keto reductase [Actinoplanes couchii]